MAEKSQRERVKKPKQRNKGAPAAANKERSPGEFDRPLDFSALDMRALSASDVMQLQGTIGNSATQALVSNGQQSSKGLMIQRRIMSVDQFKAATKEGKFTGRGKTVKAMQKLLQEYMESAFKPIDDRIQIAEELLEHTKNYLADHEGDKSRRKRIAGMISFQTSVEQELAALKQQKEKREKAGIALDESQRESKLQAIKDKHQGSAKSMFTKAAFLIDGAVPTPGDKAKLEIEFKFPVDPSSVGFVGGRFMVDLERPDNKYVKARAELTVTGGAKIGDLAEIKGELGGYMESQAQSAEKVMTLLSYAFYRRFEESKVLPRKMSSFMWGGSTSVVGFRRAERWAANVEKDVFGSLAHGTEEEKEQAKNTYVEMGGLAAASGELDVGIGKAKAAIKGSTGRRYDRASIEARKQGGLGSARRNYTFGKAQEKIGTSVSAIEVSGELGAGPLKGEAKVVWKFAGGQLEDWSVEAALTGEMPMTELVGSGIAPYIGGIVGTTNKIVRQAVAEGTNKSQGTGAFISAGETTAIGVTQLAGLPDTAFKPEFKTAPDTEGFQGKAGIKATIKFGSGGGEFSLELVKGIEVKAGVFAGKLEKGERLLRIRYIPNDDPTKSKWKVD